MRSPVIIRCLVMSAVLVFGLAPLRAEPPTVRGSDAVIWAMRTYPGVGKKKSTTRFAFTTVDDRRMRFRPLSSESVPGSISHVAVRGINLHLIFADGGHYRLQAPLDRSDDRHDVPELRLPESAVPLAICGDDAGDALVAIVPSPIGRQLQQPPTTQPAITSDGEEATISPVSPSTGYWLVRFADGAWAPDGEIPKFFDHAKNIRLAAYDGTCHLFFSLPDSPGRLMYAARHGDAWLDPRPVADIAPDSVAAALASESAVALVVTEDAGNKRVHLTPVTLTDRQWNRQQSLTRDGTTLSLPDGSWSVHRTGDHLVVVWMDNPQSMLAATWPLTGGKPTQGPIQVSALSEPANTIGTDETSQLIATAVVIILVTAVFVVRRESLLADAVIPAGYRLASFTRRILACAIDIIIVQMIAWPTVLIPWLNQYVDWTQDTWWADIQLAGELHGHELFFKWLIIAAMFIAYAFVFETLWSATPGKRIMQLRVVSERGKRCSLVALAIRNLLRIIELYPLMQFAATLLFVVLTRNRQRIGDLLAHTVVVEKSPPLPQPTPIENEPTDGNDAQ